MPRSWTPSPHEAPVILEDNLRAVQGRLPHLPVNRCMTVLRMQDGALIFHNAIALEEEEMMELEAWGTPTWLIIPGKVVHTDMISFKKRYPYLQVVCAEDSVDLVSGAIEVSGTFDELPHGPDFGWHELDGGTAGEAVFCMCSGMDFSKETLVFHETLTSHPTNNPRGGDELRKVLGLSDGLRVTPLAQRRLFSDPIRLASHLSRLSRRQGVVRIIPGSGAPVSSGARDALFAAADAVRKRPVFATVQASAER